MVLYILLCLPHPVCILLWYLEGKVLFFYYLWNEDSYQFKVHSWNHPSYVCKLVALIRLWELLMVIMAHLHWTGNVIKFINKCFKTISESQQIKSALTTNKAWLLIIWLVYHLRHVLVHTRVDRQSIAVNASVLGVHPCSPHIRRLLKPQGVEDIGACCEMSEGTQPCCPRPNHCHT